MSQELCKTCRFFEPNENPVYSGGHCHRFPPQAREQHEDLFPYLASNDWCGEHRGPKTTKEGTP